MTTTGKLGDVMKESIQRRSYVRSARALGIEPPTSTRRTTSTSTCPRARRRRTVRRPARHRHGDRDRLGADRHPGARDVAMTGEITLRGECCRSAA
jgi:hypothetical protein